MIYVMHVEVKYFGIEFFNFDFIYDFYEGIFLM